MRLSNRPQYPRHYFQIGGERLDEVLACGRRTTTATPVSISISTPTTPTAPATTTRPAWCPTRPRNPATSRSRKPGVHCIRPKHSATVNCWRHRRRPPGVTTVVTNEMIDTINSDVHAAETVLDAALDAHQAIPARLPLAAGQPRPAGPRHRDQTDPPRHPHRRVQHRAVPCSCDRHRHRLHPRQRRSPQPDPHRTRRLRRHHPRPRHPAHPARPAPRATPYRRPRRTLPSPQRHRHRLPRHRPDPALQHQIPPITAHQLLSYVRSPDHRDDYPSEWAAITVVSKRLGMTAETLRSWIRQQ